MRKRLALGSAFLTVGILTGVIGYYLGSKRSSYRHCRGAIYTAISSNAKLDAKYYDRIYRDNDVVIRANYYGIQTFPKWLVSLFTLGEERSVGEARRYSR